MHKQAIPSPHSEPMWFPLIHYKWPRSPFLKAQTCHHSFVFKLGVTWLVKNNNLCFKRNLNLKELLLNFLKLTMCKELIWWMFQQWQTHPTRNLWLANSTSDMSVIFTSHQNAKVLTGNSFDSVSFSFIPPGITRCLSSLSHMLSLFSVKNSASSALWCSCLFLSKALTIIIPSIWHMWCKVFCMAATAFNGIGFLGSSRHSNQIDGQFPFLSSWVLHRFWLLLLSWFRVLVIQGIGELEMSAAIVKWHLPSFSVHQTALGPVGGGWKVLEYCNLQDQELMSSRVTPSLSLPAFFTLSQEFHIINTKMSICNTIACDVQQFKKPVHWGKSTVIKEQMHKCQQASSSRQCEWCL